MLRPALLLPLVLLSGCVASTRTLDVTDAASRQAMSERAGRQQALVTVRGERAEVARGLRVAADSTTWIDGAGRARSAPTTSVVRVAFPGADPRGRLGRLEGFAVGFAVAFAGGAVLTYATYEPEGFIAFPTSFAAGAVGLVFGVGGGGIGASVANGRPERFVLVPSAAPPR